jgi:hypothetical protein
MLAISTAIIVAAALYFARSILKSANDPKRGQPTSGKHIDDGAVAAVMRR